MAEQNLITELLTDEIAAKIEGLVDDIVELAEEAFTDEENPESMTAGNAILAAYAVGHAADVMRAWVEEQVLPVVKEATQGTGDESGS